MLVVGRGMARPIEGLWNQPDGLHTREGGGRPGPGDAGGAWWLEGEGAPTTLPPSGWRLTPQERASWSTSQSPRPLGVRIDDSDAAAAMPVAHRKMQQVTAQLHPQPQISAGRTTALVTSLLTNSTAPIHQRVVGRVIAVPAHLPDRRGPRPARFDRGQDQLIAQVGGSGHGRSCALEPGVQLQEVRHREQGRGSGHRRLGTTGGSRGPASGGGVVGHGGARRRTLGQKAVDPVVVADQRIRPLAEVLHQGALDLGARTRDDAAVRATTGSRR